MAEEEDVAAEAVVPKSNKKILPIILVVNTLLMAGVLVFVMKRPAAPAAPKGQTARPPRPPNTANKLKRRTSRKGRRQRARRRGGGPWTEHSARQLHRVGARDRG